jgi:hypothetical protein
MTSSIDVSSEKETKTRNMILRSWILDLLACNELSIEYPHLIFTLNKFLRFKSLPRIPNLISRVEGARHATSHNVNDM